MPGQLKFLVALFTLTRLLPAQEPGEFFESRVRPVLSKNCFACHTNSKLGGLQVDSRDHLLKGGNSGPAIVPGQPESSLLIQAVRRSHERFKMPPQGKLSDEEVSNLSAWVKMGAVWPESPPAASTEYKIRPEQRAFWSFQPVRKPAVPEGKAPSAIDRFVLAKLQSQGLKPVRPADRRALIRRVTFDLIGLPPTPEEVDAFVADRAPDAFAKVVDRLLASPHYGERWARSWLDLARYADGNLGAYKDTPYPYAYRYRDWVIRAFNDDMPYDRFVKAQLAADLMPDNKELLPALGFHALGGNADERVDVTTRVFLGLTVGCAQCHDHKYDPIPTKDYYSLLGVFRSSENYEIPLAPEAEVKAYDDLTKRIEDQKFEVDDFLRKKNVDLAEMLVRKTARYMVAAFANADAAPEHLDPQILERWKQYLKAEKEHPYLKPWDALVARGGSIEEARKLADEFQAFVIAMFDEKKIKDDRNYVALGGVKGVRDEKTRQYTNLEGLDIEKYYLWRDLASEPYKKEFLDFKGGVYYFGDKQIDRFLSAEAREYYAGLKADLAALKAPKQYPFINAIRDSKKPADVRVAIRGDAATPGEVAPRRNLSILCDGEPARFTKGSGRLELAESIVSPGNPLAARVIVNRIWKMHFGRGIVSTPSNFGQVGERPTHPELLDYLASRFVENGWSIKSMHREILLSATYQLSADHNQANSAKDPENRLLWRANLRQRLDAEELRDSLLAVAGKLDLSMYGPPLPLTDTNRRRTIYGYVGRTQPDRMLTLFDFPNPNNMSEERTVTVGPMQRLYFLNNDFVMQDAKAVAERLDAESDEAKIAQAYRLLFGRTPTKPETRLGLDFLNNSSNNRSNSPARKQGDAWRQYAQALLSSSEFSSVN